MPGSGKNQLSVVFHQKVKKTAKANTSFRKVIYDGKFSELAVMSIAPHSELGEEAHKSIDEILFVVKGKGQVILNGRTHKIRQHDAIFVASREDHNLKNVGRKDLKLLCVCSPPYSKVSPEFTNPANERWRNRYDMPGSNDSNPLTSATRDGQDNERS